MDGETMIRSRASDRHDPEDHLGPLSRKLVGFERAQVRVPIDLPERLSYPAQIAAALEAEAEALDAPPTPPEVPHAAR